MFTYYKLFSRPLFQVRNFSSHLKKKIAPIKMSYKIFNADQNTPPILIMHGLLGSKMNWNGIARQLEAINRKVVIMDARNHGDSPHHHEMTYEHLAEDIHQLMTELNSPKATCIGHSMGGRAMMMFAINYPQLVKHLIVVDISPFSSTTLNETPKYMEALLKVRFSSGIPIGRMRKLAFEQLEESIPDKDTRQFLLTNLIEKEGTFKWKSNIEMLFQNIDKILHFNVPENRSFEGPTLFLAGAKSDFVNPSMHQRIQEIFPKAEFFYVEGAGHNVHYDKPSEFIQHTLNFIEK